jgi:hypothetical protein
MTHGLEITMNWKQLFNFCPYTHVFRSIKTAVQEKRLPQAAKTGIFIALLGFFCPLFWVPFILGTPLSELWFDILHSGAFVAVGIGMFLWGVLAQREQ